MFGLPLFIPVIFLTLMFFLSGINKYNNFLSTSKGFATKMKQPLRIAKMVITAVIALEIIAPLIITLHSMSIINMRLLTQLSIYGLALFTIVATYLYHFPPNVNGNYYSFMSNLSTLGGLMILSYLI
jgi:uncharacterized membrane protein YphA (DoxX/SURF4 family)